MVITAVITEEEAAQHALNLKLGSSTKANLSPLPHADHSTGTIKPITHPPPSKVDFGAEVYGIDLNHFTDADFALIHDALHRHKLLVFKEQPDMLHPTQQYRLTAHFDPDETTGGFAHGADPLLTSHNGVNIYGIPKRPAVPVQPQVHILGRGPLPEGEDYYGFPPGFQVEGIDHADFHLPPHIPRELREGQSTTTGEGEHEKPSKAYGRFYQWHFDGSLYAIPPPRVGCLLAVRVPKGPDVTIRWDDGSGTEMPCAPGATAMVTGSRALALLDEPTRALVLHSRVEYAPHAFVWMARARSARLGHVLATEGRERDLFGGGDDDDNTSSPPPPFPKWEKDKVCTYPMVWTNPVTGEKSLQVHGQGALRLFLKEGPGAEEKVVDDLAEVRAFMDK